MGQAELAAATRNRAGPSAWGVRGCPEWWQAGDWCPTPEGLGAVAAGLCGHRQVLALTHWSPGAAESNGAEAMAAHAQCAGSFNAVLTAQPWEGRERVPTNRQ